MNWREIVDLLHFKNNSTDYMSQKIFRKNQLKKSKNPLNLGKKYQNTEKNCLDFLVQKIFVRFFQSNLPLGLHAACSTIFPLTVNKFSFSISSMLQIK